MYCIYTAERWKQYTFFLMRLCHPPDGSTSPKYRLLCFIAFNRDRCCHLVLCLRLIPFHYVIFVLKFWSFTCSELPSFLFHFLLVSSNTWIRTLDIRIGSRVFYHSAHPTGQLSGLVNSIQLLNRKQKLRSRQSNILYFEQAHLLTLCHLAKSESVKCHSANM